MRPLQARLVTLCQQVLALGVVLVVLTPASGVVSLDIVGEHPGQQPAGTAGGQALPAELVSATVPTKPVTPHVTEVPLTGSEGGFSGLRGRTVAGELGEVAHAHGVCAAWCRHRRNGPPMRARDVAGSMPAEL